MSWTDPEQRKALRWRAEIVRLLTESADAGERSWNGIHNIAKLQDFGFRDLAEAETVAKAPLEQLLGNDRHRRLIARWRK